MSLSVSGAFTLANGRIVPSHKTSILTYDTRIRSAEVADQSVPISILVLLTLDGEVRPIIRHQAAAYVSGEVFLDWDVATASLVGRVPNATVLPAPLFTGAVNEPSLLLKGKMSRVALDGGRNGGWRVWVQALGRRSVTYACEMGSFDMDLAYHLHRAIQSNPEVELTGIFINQCKDLQDHPTIVVRPTKLKHMMAVPMSFYPSMQVEAALPREFAIPVHPDAYTFPAPADKKSKAPKGRKAKKTAKDRYVSRQTALPRALSPLAMAFDRRHSAATRTRRGAAKLAIWGSGPAANTRSRLQ